MTHVTTWLLPHDQRLLQENVESASSLGHRKNTSAFGWKGKQMVVVLVLETWPPLDLLLGNMTVSHSKSSLANYTINYFSSIKVFYECFLQIAGCFCHREIIKHIYRATIAEMPLGAAAARQWQSGSSICMNPLLVYRVYHVSAWKIQQQVSVLSNKRFCNLNTLSIIGYKTSLPKNIIWQSSNNNSISSNDNYYTIDALSAF